MPAWSSSATGPGHDRPVDVRVHEGRVAEIGAGLERPARRTRVRRRGPLADPGAVGPARPPRPVDRLLAAARPRADPRRPRRRRRWWPSGSPSSPTHPVIGWGHRLSRWDRDPTVTELDAVAPDDPGDPDQRRRPPRLAQHRRPDRAGPPGARQGGLRGRVVPRLRPPRHPGRQRRHLPGGLPAHPRGRGRDGRDRHRRLRVQRRRRRTGPSASPRARTCSGSGWRRTPTASTPSSRPASAPATCCPAATSGSRWGRSR